MKQDFKDLIRFSIFALLALLLDLFVYFLLVSSGLQVGPSNFLSSSVSVLVMYVTSTRKVFKVAGSRTKFLAFVIWYVTSITLFSAFAHFLALSIGFGPLIAKASVVPGSFVVNFFAVRAILRPQLKAK